MLVIGLALGALVSGGIAYLVSPSQEDVRRAAAEAAEAAMAAAREAEPPRAAEPAPAQPKPKPAPRPGPAATKKPEAASPPQPKVAAPREDPKPRRLSRRQRRRLTKYLYLSRKAMRQRRYNAARYYANKALKIQPVDARAQALKKRADRRLGR
jgi:outer membrane biosynthesis protein TonB